MYKSVWTILTPLTRKPHFTAEQSTTLPLDSSLKAHPEELRNQRWPRQDPAAQRSVTQHVWRNGGADPNGKEHGGNTSLAQLTTRQKRFRARLQTALIRGWFAGQKETTEKFNWS